MEKNVRAPVENNVFKKIISHTKEYGFVFPSSEIYDGLQAVYDYGQNGVELKNNIKQSHLQHPILLYPSTLNFLRGGHMI